MTNRERGLKSIEALVTSIEALGLSTIVAIRAIKAIDFALDAVELPEFVREHLISEKEAISKMDLEAAKKWADENFPKE